MRLIDADALTKWLRTNKANVNLLDYNTSATYAECITMVEAMETIDAVPVVRCKDCKHYNKSLYEDGGVCDLIDYIMDGYYHGTFEEKKPDDFCSCGERTDGGAEDENA